MKIDWDKYEGFQFAAMEECGDWRLYREMPHLSEYGGWEVADGQDDYEDCELIFNDDDDVRTRSYKYAYNYMDTLVEFPNQPSPPKDVVYISGPMGGYPRYNSDAFYKAEEKLKKAGYGVINPVRIDEELGFDPDNNEELTDGFKQTARSRDIELLNNHATHIYMLDGWSRSRGATAEYYFALWAGLEVRFSYCDKE